MKTVGGTGPIHSCEETIQTLIFLCACVCAKLLQSWPTLCDPMDCVAWQAPLSMGFSRKEYWSGLPCPSSGDLPNPGIKPACLMSPALAGRLFTTPSTWEAPPYRYYWGAWLYFSQITSWCIVTGNHLLYFVRGIKETLLRKTNESDDLEINPFANQVASIFFFLNKIEDDSK